MIEYKNQKVQISAVFALEHQEVIIRIELLEPGVTLEMPLEDAALFASDFIAVLLAAKKHRDNHVPS